MDYPTKLLEVTKRVFSNWSALKIMFENGHVAKENIEELTEFIANTLCSSEVLEASDIADVLEDIIESKSDVEIDDGSYNAIAEELIRFYKYAKNNDEDNFKIAMDNLSPLQSWIISPPPRVHRYITQDSSDEESSKNNESMEVDEWVTVKSKRGSHK